MFLSFTELMKISRRQFVGSAAVGLLGRAALSANAAERSDSGPGGEKPLIVSTWPFGKAANDKAIKVLLEGRSILDAVEEGICVTESSGNGSVGRLPPWRGTESPPLTMRLPQPRL